MNLYRIQDRDGRGPYKPGFSHRWSDPRDGSNPDRAYPNIFEDFGMDWKADINSGEFCGCAFDSLESLRAWFSETELLKLAYFGYRIVMLDDCRIVRQSKHQILFARNVPLKLATTVIPIDALPLAST